MPAGWRLTAAICSDANAAATGNAGTFGTLVGSQLTVPAAFVEPGADITCTFTNEKLARLVVQKTANGGPGTFTFSTTGGLSPSSFSLSPTLALPTQTQTFADLVPGTYTVTEGPSAPFQLTDLTCVAGGTSAPGSTVTAGAVTRQVSATLVAGADYTCTYTNVRDAQVTVTKTAIGGDATFGFTTSGTGNAIDPAPSITTAAGVGSSSFGVVFASGVATRTVTITEPAPPPGWVLTGINCTDGTGAAVGTVTLPSVTITAAPGQTYNCNVTNQRLPRVTVVKQSIGGTGPFTFTGGTNGLPASLTLDTTAANPQASTPYQVTALGAATAITETVPAAYTLTSATCVTAGGTPVSTSLAGGTLTIGGTAIVGGGDLTCTFVNTRRSAQVRVDKRWLGAITGNAVSITATGGTNNPSLAATANTSNEVDAGSPVTVYAGETLTFAEAFTSGSAANYTTSLACTGASDATPGNGLTIAPVDDGATIVCTYTNSRLPNVVKSAGSVTGPNAQGQYVASYSVVVDNPGGATAYGALTDTPAFAPQLEVLGATWTVSSTSGPAPAGGTVTGTGPFTLAPGGTAIPASATHTYAVTVTFRFLTYTAAAPCGGPGTGLFNSAGTATTETTTADNTACVPPPVPPLPSIDVQKSASPASVSAPGQTVSYSFLVTNTGNVTLSSVAVSDPLVGLSAVTCPVATLAPGASTTCTASYTVTQTDIDAGSIANTATAAGSAPNGSAVNDSDSETVIAVRTPSISLVKSVTPATVSAAGDSVAYSFLVTNTGNVTLASVGVSDPLPGLSTITCPVATLAPGVSTTCTASYAATQTDIDSGSIPNTATASGTPPAGPAVTATDDAVVTAPAAPSITVDKSSSPLTVSAAGDVIAYSFLVTNTGNVTLASVGVSDPLSGLSAVTCPVATLAPGVSTTCTASYTVSQTDIDAGSIANTATASGTPPVGAPVTDTDARTVPVVQAPSVSLAKTATPATVSAAGDVVAYSFLVTNTGNVTVSSVAVSDPLPGLSTVTCPVATLAPGVSTTCTASYTVTQPDVDGGSIVNTATASGTPPTGAAVIDIDSATVTAPPAPSISLVKSAAPGTVSAAGDVVTYSFAVTNTGNVTLSSVGVSDPLPGLSAVTCPVATLAPGASTTCTASYTVAQDDVDDGSISNTATAAGAPPGGGAPVTDADTALVTVTQSPSISVVKSATPATVSADGDVVAYSFAVANTGNVTLTSVGVADPLPGLSVVTCPVATLAPGASTTCTATYTVTQDDMDAGSIANTATATGMPPVGAAATDTDSALVTVTQSPSIDVAKSAVPNNVTAAGQTVAYSLVVANTGNVTLTSVGVADPLPGLSVVTCPVATLAPGASTTCAASYTVTQDDVDAGSIANTATASGTPPVGGPVSDTDAATVTASQSPSIQVVKSAAPATVTAAGDTVAYSFVVTNTGNVTLASVGVADPLPGLSAVTCPVASLAPGASTTCAASYSVSQGDVDAGSIANTATASGTPPLGGPVTDSDSALVTVTQSPSISVVKSAAPTTVTAAGDSVAYSFVLTNTGNVTLSSVGVADPLPGLSAVTCPVATLAPGASTMCSASYSVTQGDVDAGSIANTATASGTPPVGAAVTDVDSALVSVTQSPSISVVKSAAPTTVTAAGDSVAYSFVVSNTGNVTLTSVGVADPLPGLSAVSCPVATLAPASITTCTASYTVTQTDVDVGSISNSATASGAPPVGAPVTDTDSALVSVTQSPSLDLAKSASPANVTAAGQTIAYTFVVTNTGNVTLDPVVVTDPLAGLSPITCPASVLAPGAGTTCSATYTTTVADIDAGGVTNLATAIGTPPPGAGAPVSDTDGETVTAIDAPSIQVVKTAAPLTVSAAGDTVAYSFVVTNTGNVTLSSVGVADPLPGLSAVTCPVASLAPGASTTCAASYSVSQVDVDAGSIANTATASGTPPLGGPVTDSDSALVTVTQSPSISVVKSAAPTTVTAAGNSVAYSFVVTNTGNVTLASVGVADPLPGLSAVTCLAATLAPGASTTCSASYSVSQVDVDAGSIANTAIASGTPPVGGPVSDADSALVTVTQAPSISVVKSAVPAIVTAAGDSVAYSFVVTNTGNVTLSSVGVADPLPGLSAVTCPVASLAPGASTMCSASYSVSQVDVDAGSIANTATASGTPPVGRPGERHRLGARDRHAGAVDQCGEVGGPDHRHGCRRHGRLLVRGDEHGQRDARVGRSRRSTARSVGGHLPGCGVGPGRVDDVFGVVHGDAGRRRRRLHREHCDGVGDAAGRACHDRHRRRPP